MSEQGALLWEPWVPEEGQRVRVRISAECQHEVNYDRGLDGISIGEAFVERVGHDPAEDDHTGTVIAADPLDERYVSDPRWRTFEAHRFMVDFDDPVIPAIVDYPQKCQYFAACELVPLPDDGEGGA